MAVSNGQFLPFFPVAPLPEQGVTVRIISCDDLFNYNKSRNPFPQPLAVISRFVECVISPEIGDVCAGSLTLLAADDFWDRPLRNGNLPASELYSRQHLFVVLEDGLVRGEFIGQSVEHTLIDVGEESARAIVISGPGQAQMLDWAKVMTPYYPKTPPKNVIGVYQFKDKPVMAAWLQLLAASQKRGTIPFITPTFTAVHDTAKVKWEDTYTPPPKNTATVLLGGSVLFATDSYVLSSGGQAAVKKITAKIAKITYPSVTVTGYTDSSGSVAYNYQLGLDRANAVADAILAVFPLAAMTVISRGEKDPIATNGTAAGRAKNRRVRVTYQTTSNSGAHSVYEPDRGVSLLSLLKDLTGGAVVTDRSPIHVEWIMQPSGRLTICGRIGKDRSSKIKFWEGSTCVVSESMHRGRENIANLIAVQTDRGEYTIATDNVSRKRWLQREFFQRLSGTYTSAVRSKIAAAQKALLASEDVSWTVKISAAEGRRPFVDFTLGDTIGLALRRPGYNSEVVNHRVMAITMTVGIDGVTAYELRLESARASRIRALQAQLDSLVTRPRGVQTHFGDDVPTGGQPGDFYTPYE